MQVMVFELMETNVRLLVVIQGETQKLNREMGILRGELEKLRMKNMKHEETIEAPKQHLDINKSCQEHLPPTRQEHHPPTPNARYLYTQRRDPTAPSSQRIAPMSRWLRNNTAG